MKWDVVEVRAEPERTLWIRFADGLSGRVQLKSEDCGGVLAVLNDPQVFSQAFVEHGAVTWPGGIDWAPDALYDLVAVQN